MSYQASSNRQTYGIVALVLGLLGFGGFGIHKFMMGKTNAGIITIVASIFTCGLFGVIVSIAEGIIYLTKSDAQWEQEYMMGGKEWF
jgi:TM2 domain-containing membrane protein YozV